MKAHPAIASDGTVYISSFDGKLYALDPDDGSLLFLGVVVAPCIDADVKDLDMAGVLVDCISDEPEQYQRMSESGSILIDSNECIFPENECGCDQCADWEFPIICGVLGILFEIVLMFSPFPVPALGWLIILLAERLDCPNIPP